MHSNNGIAHLTPADSDLIHTSKELSHQDIQPNFHQEAEEGFIHLILNLEGAEE
jgi:hypothetical protein